MIKKPIRQADKRETTRGIKGVRAVASTQLKKAQKEGKARSDLGA